MENNLHNSYVFQALDAYPYNLEETLEALNYALSYNEKDAQALCLMGRVYAEQLKNYETAKQYFAEAIAQHMEMPKTYPFYIQTLLWNEDYVEAQKLIDFAKTLKGVDKALLQLMQGVLFEKLGQFKIAIKTFKAANKTATNNDFIRYVDNELSRVKKKMKPKKKCKKKKKKSNKKRKEK
ncbi:tetratricopeptide repeat protein [Winogradskyella sp. R77965]|uniref:tetratricopeptide repeat protein n=1 Tax=Winogradskyella sp. R77965 TaxID=3093872 RepID=UPI0037DC3DCD